MNETMLEIDYEVERALTDPAAAGPDESALALLIAADESRALWGLGRAYQRERSAQERLAEEAATIQREYSHRFAMLGDRASMIERYIEDIVKARRERGEGNSVDLPSIGRWSTRAVKAGWEVSSGAEAERALVAFLRESYEAEATAIIEERPHIKRDQLRAWLDSLDDETIVPVIEGLGEYIERRPERISVSFKSAS